MDITHGMIVVIVYLVCFLCLSFTEWGRQH
jgi:hypothetical protein